MQEGTNNPISQKTEAADEIIDILANQVWESTGGQLVQVVYEYANTDAVNNAGDYIGGFTGAAIGAAFPELEVPLVISGNFVGEIVGAFLRLVAGDIAGAVTDNFIKNEIIDPSAEYIFNK